VRSSGAQLGEKIYYICRFATYDGLCAALV
jgi:hypothetical protein